MNRARKLASTLALGLGACSGMALAAAETQTRRVVTVQDAPHALSGPVGVLERGATVQLLECGEEFLRIRRERDGVEGYVDKAAVTRLVCPGAEQAEPTPGATRVGAGPAADPGRDPDDGQQPAALATVPLPQEDFAIDEQAFMPPGEPLLAGSRSVWYVALAAGTARHGASRGELAAALRPHASVVDVRFVEQQASSWNLTLGYAMSPRWRIEGSLVDLGSYDSVIDLRNADADAVRRVLSRRYPIAGTGVHTRIIGGQGFGSWFVSGSAGVFHGFDPEVDLTVDGQVLRLKGEATAPTFGLAAWYRISPAWQLGVVGSYMSLNQNMLQTALGIRLAL